MAKCKYCGKAITWVKTKDGHSMPCDSKEVLYWAMDKGPVKIVTMNGEVISATLKGDINKPTGLGYIPHWATCTHTAQAKADAKKKVIIESTPLF